MVSLAREVVENKKNMKSVRKFCDRRTHPGLTAPIFDDVNEGSDAVVESNVHGQSVTKMNLANNRRVIAEGEEGGKNDLNMLRCVCGRDGGGKRVRGYLQAGPVCARIRKSCFDLHFKQERLDYIVGFVQYNITLMLAPAHVHDRNS